MALSAAILLSRLSWSGLQRALNISEVKIIEERTFYKTQKKYLFKRRDNVIQKLKPEKLDVVGGGRYDSPGHSAKYGTYTIMNDETNEIIDFFVAHVSNAGNSSRMELYEFQKVLE